MPSRPLLAATFVVAVLLAGWLWYAPESPRRDGDVSPTVERKPADSKGLTGDGNDNSPFALASGAAPSDASGSIVASTSVTGVTSGDTASRPGTDPESTPAVTLLPVDITQIARAPLSDEEHEYLVQRLRDDPMLLQQLIDEFRQEPDQARRDRLLRLLGEAGGDAVTRTASELIFSGDEASRKTGLALLQLVQPGNSEARDIVSGMLATEVQPGVLIDTLTTLADPGSVDDNSRAFLADQVSLLTSHDDAAVRSISLSILSRWSTDGRDTPVLLDALQDTEQRVRESAAYALVGHEVVNQSVIDSLWAVAVDEGDTKATRSAAVLALRGMQLSDAQRRDLAAVERQLATVRRSQ